MNQTKEQRPVLRILLINSVRLIYMMQNSKIIFILFVRRIHILFPFSSPWKNDWTNSKKLNWIKLFRLSVYCFRYFLFRFILLFGLGGGLGVRIILYECIKLLKHTYFLHSQAFLKLIGLIPKRINWIKLVRLPVYCVRYFFSFNFFWHGGFV